jgi:phage gp36-like protein
MPYCTQADITNQLPLADLIALTDDANTGEVDSSLVDQAIATAGATIDAYCHGRYPLPLTPVPARIVQLAVDLAIYEIVSRRAVDEVPKIRETRKAEAIRFLERLESGASHLAATTPEPTAGSNEATMTTAASPFGRDSRSRY